MIRLTFSQDSLSNTTPVWNLKWTDKMYRYNFVCYIKDSYVTLMLYYMYIITPIKTAKFLKIKEILQAMACLSWNTI